MEFVCDNEPPSLLPIPFVNTTKKLTSGQIRVRRGVWKNGWTLPDLRGEKLSVSVVFGTGAVTTAIVVRHCDHGLLGPTRRVHLLQKVRTGTREQFLGCRDGRMWYFD